MSEGSILLVEDEPTIALDEKIQLEKRGYIVQHVASGEKAVAAILDACCSVDLVLMDIDLGKGMDGTQAAGKILAQKDLPIVFLSSHTEPEIVEKTEKITSYGYVVKNSGMVVLDASIKMALKLFAAKTENKKVQKVFEESENRKRRYFEHAPIGIFVVNHKGDFLEVNPRACELLGYSAEEFAQKNIAELLISEDLKLGLKHFERVKTEEYSYGEFRFQKNDGSIHWFSMAATKLTDDLFLGFGDDISKRIEQEEYLEKFKQIISSTADGISLLDRNYRYVIVNKAYENYSGIKMEDLIGLTVEEYLGTDVFRNHIKPHIDRCLNGEVIIFKDWFDYPQLGRRYVEVSYYPYVDAKGGISGIVANTNDITSTVGSASFAEGS